MGTVLEEINALKLKVLAGKENEMVHVVYVDQDRKRKRENKGPKPQTRFTLNCDSPEAFAELYGHWDRIMLQVRNKSIAITILIDWLRALTPERIEKKLKDGAAHAPEQATTPSDEWIEGRDEPGLNEIPEWLRE